MIDNLLSEPITETDTQQFCVEMMKRLDIQRRQEDFCDVILEVGSGDDQARLKAHRNVLCAASPFFYNALNSDMKEKNEGVIRLEKTSKAVMETVLEYLYTGHIEVTQLNAFDLLEIADFLVLPILKEASSKFISPTLSSSNCLMMYYSAVMYQCHEMEKQAREFVFANFMSATECEDFLKLNVTQVEEWISSDEIRVKGEEEVFQVIVKWMEGRQCEERERFFELFRHVRLVYLSRNYVFNDILLHPLVKDSETCTAFVHDAMKEVSYGSEECFFSQPPRNCLKTTEDCLVLCGLQKATCFLPSENKWYELEDIPCRRKYIYSVSRCHGKLYIHGGSDYSQIERYDPSVNSWTPVESYSDTIACRTSAIVNFQGFLYVIGGRKDGKIVNNVYKYDPDTNLWQEVAAMSLPRCHICAVADKDSLYAIGGCSEHGKLDEVEKFDPKANSWCKVASTNEKKYYSCGVIIRGKVLLLGGFTSHKVHSSLIEMYDPTLNTWTSTPSVPAPVHFYNVVSFKEKVFVLGLWRQDGPKHTYLKVYDVDKNEWNPCSQGPHGFQLLTLAPLRIPKDILKTCKVIT